MSSAKASLIKSAALFSLAAMCMIYPQQIGGVFVKALVLFSDIFSKIVTSIFLKAIGV